MGAGTAGVEDIILFATSANWSRGVLLGRNARNCWQFAGSRLRKISRKRGSLVGAAPCSTVIARSSWEGVLSPRTSA